MGRLPGQAAAGEVHVLLAADDAEHQQGDGGHGGGLEAAAGRSRGCAHQHQQAAEQLGTVAHRPQVHGVKARRAHGDGLEEGVEQLFKKAPFAQGTGVAPFGPQVKQGAEQQQPARHHQHDPGVEGQRQPLFPPAFAQILGGFDDHRKAQAAQDNHQRNGQKHQRVLLVGRQALKTAQQVEPGVAEGADGVERRVPEPLRPAQGRHEAQGQKDGAQELDSQGQQAVGAAQGNQAGQGAGVQRFLEELALPKRDPVAQQHHHPGGDDHEPKAPHLNEHQQDDLPKEGKGRPRIHRHQARHADGGGGGKQSAEPADALPLLGRKGEGQEHGPDQDQQQKAGGQQPLRPLRQGGKKGFRFQFHNM